ncbi:MAG: hypothetical protein J6A53_04370 [Clostridia bacterium]|nr:hypothetical protein [Clostridia bacterium]
MIIEPKKTTLAYRCPACGGVPTSIVGAFSLSGDLFKLKCDCGGSFLTVQKASDGQFRLTVPCVSCPRPHDYLLSKNVFFNSDSFIIPCSLCGIDICFLGHEDKVSEAIKYSNDEIVKMLGDYAIQQIKTKENDLNIVDPQIMEIVRFVVSDLHEEGKIYCNCENNDGDYVVDILDDFVSVNCKKCGAKAIIPADSTIAAHDFLNADSITLK